MNIILLILFGALVGWLTSLIMKTNRQQGLIMDVVLGIAGSLLGGYLMDVLGYSSVTGFDLYSILVGIGGSLLLVMLWRAISSAVKTV